MVNKKHKGLGSDTLGVHINNTTRTVTLSLPLDIEDCDNEDYIKNTLNKIFKEYDKVVACSTQESVFFWLSLGAIFKDNSRVISGEYLEDDEDLVSYSFTLYKSVYNKLKSKVSLDDNLIYSCCNLYSNTGMCMQQLDSISKYSKHYKEYLAGITDINENIFIQEVKELADNNYLTL